MFRRCIVMTTLTYKHNEQMTKMLVKMVKICKSLSERWPELKIQLMDISTKITYTYSIYGVC